MAFGPIDIVVIEFPHHKFEGGVLAGLTDLVSQEVIRILDLVLVRKDEHGEAHVREMQELSSSELLSLEPLRAEISSMITAEDIRMIEKKLAWNTTAVVMLFENLWAIRLKQDVLDGGARLVLHERIPSDVVTEAVQDLAEYD